MNIALFGAKGMLGRVLDRRLRKCGWNVTSYDLPEADITDFDATLQIVKKDSPNVILNVAAYTNVDGAETERELCYAVNTYGAQVLARCAAEVGAKGYYISTDYVFDGLKQGVYDEYDMPAPLNYYGECKRQGEAVMEKFLPDDHVILRTSWLYGAGGKNFPNTMLSLAAAGRDLRVIQDQFGSPTYTVDLAEAIVKFIENGTAVGIYHVTNSGYCSWFDFAQEIFRVSGVHPPSLKPCSAAEYPTAAARPLNSRLSPKRTNALDCGPLPTWQEAIGRYLSNV